MRMRLSGSVALLWGLSIVAVVLLAVASYVVRFYDDEVKCDQTCIAESGEEP
jgi:hypothetical protein